jgi:hypothetical protein
LKISDLIHFLEIKANAAIPDAFIEIKVGIYDHRQ